MGSRVRRLIRDQRGATILEFAIAAPSLFLLLFALFGAGLDGLYQQFLDDAVRDAARQVQIAAPASGSGSAFVSALCTRFGVLATSCQTTVTYAVQAGTVSSGFAGLTPEVLGATGRFSNSFFATNPFAPNVPVLVQVAYPLPFSLPYVAKLVTWTGTSSIVAQAAIRVEPYQ